MILFITYHTLTFKGGSVGNVFPKWTNKIPLMIAVVVPVVAIALTGLVWYTFSPKFTDVGYTPTQPVPFSHKLHAGDLGMDCRYCHTTVEKTAYAAIPSTEICMNCHKIILPESLKLSRIRESFDSNKPLEWVNVHLLPKYAAFDHSAHVSAGVSCVSCHGRVDQMIEVGQVATLSMGWCLECHRNPTPHLRPVSEVTNLAWDAKQAQYDPTQDPHRTRSVNPPEHCSACHY